MNDTPKKNTPPLFMPCDVPSEYEAQCAALLEQWGTGKCAIVEDVRDDQQTDIAISDAEILAILQEVDAGKICVTPVGESNWHRMYCGVMEFRLSNGWRLGVFNDCMSWDYIEWVTAPDGRRVDYMAKDQTTGQLRFARMPSLDWQPDHPERWGDWDLIKEALAADAESKT